MAKQEMVPWGRNALVVKVTNIELTPCTENMSLRSVCFWKIASMLFRYVLILKKPSPTDWHKKSVISCASQGRGQIVVLLGWICFISQSSTFAPGSSINSIHLNCSATSLGRK